MELSSIYDRLWAVLLVIVEILFGNYLLYLSHNPVNG